MYSIDDALWPPLRWIGSSRLQVAELREELSGRGLDTSGLKAELVSRLLGAIEG